MLKSRAAIFSAACVSLSSCGTPEQTIQQVSKEQRVEVPRIISALKCAFSRALDEEARLGHRRRLEGSVANVTLKLNVTDTTDASGNLQAAPSVLTLGAGGSITPRVSGSYTKTNTVITTLKFRLRLKHEPQYPTACNANPQVRRDAYGFQNWLASTIDGLEVNTPFTPAGALDSIDFSGSFGVKKKGGGGADFDVIWVSGKGDLSSERNDVQDIDFTIQRPSKDVPLPTNKPGDNGATTMNNGGVAY